MSTPLSEPLLSSTARPSIDHTFATMQRRKARRYFYTVHERQGRVAAGWLLAYVGALALAVGTESIGWAPGGFPMRWSPTKCALAGVMCAVMLSTVTRAPNVTCFCVFWLYLSGLVLLGARTASGVARHQGKWLLYRLATAEIATLIAHWAFETALPALILRYWHHVQPWEVRPLPCTGGGLGGRWPRLSYVYRPRYWLRSCCRDDADVDPVVVPSAATIGGPEAACSDEGGGRETEVGGLYSFTYRGELSATSGRPNGYGEWIDTSKHGECLQGLWAEGEPVGPFRSCESGSGHAFVCLRVGYVASHDGCAARAPSPRSLARSLSSSPPPPPPPPGPRPHARCIPPVPSSASPRSLLRLLQPPLASVRRPFHRMRLSVRRAESLRFGVGTVECCISGQCFSRFPRCSPLPLSLGLPDPDVAARPDSDVDAERDVRLAACIRSLLAPPYPQPVRITRPSWLPSFAPTAEAVLEAVLYIPGFNTSLGHAIKRFGQMLALADLPAHMLRFVFSWPGGRMVSYAHAKRATAEAWMAADLLAFLAALRGGGVRRVHLLCHSMGAMVLLHSLPALLASRLVASRSLALANVILLSPDFPTATFLSTSHPLLKALGAHTTIYGDRDDRPLSYSELFNGVHALGRLRDAPWGRASDRADGHARRPAPGREGARSKEDGDKGATDGAVAEEDDEDDEERAARRESEWLDVDVIDTTHMQAGLPAGEPELALNVRLRHAHFTINRLMVDDLAELLLHGHRAEQRTSRLQRRAGNVFHFFAPPV